MERELCWRFGVEATRPGKLATPPEDLEENKAAIEIHFWLRETYKLLRTVITGSQKSRNLERSGAMQALAP